MTEEVVGLAWMRMMGAESVAYHRHTVLGRGDDYPGAALDYYASRGETPLVWGGTGAPALHLFGAVSADDYDAVYGRGGAYQPVTGDRLVSATRPGVELVVSAHKSVALLGVIGRAEDMHQILDAETDATLAALDAWARQSGGRRGRAQVRTATGGLIWAATRHATSRAGDPEPHDHVLVANLVAMADERGGWKGLDTASLRDLLHSATATGRVAAAAKAVELGYGIEADNGPSGRLGHWRIAGIPVAACELMSKRAAEITAATTSKGFATYQARGLAARDTRKAKGDVDLADLMPAWQTELSTAGYAPDDLLAAVDAASAAQPAIPPRLTGREVAALAAHALGPTGRLAEQKVFCRPDVIVAVAPLLFGRDPAELGRVVDAVCAHPDAVALIGVAGARSQAFAPACVLAVETAIAAKAATGANHLDRPAVDADLVAAAVAAKEETLGRALTDGQRKMVAGICGSGRGVEMVLGVAGAGKTTALDVARQAFEAAGYRVIGTSISGQAARTLGREAGIGEARTMASLLWRLDNHRLALDAGTIVILDEAGMADDPSVLCLLAATETAGSKVVLVGDHLQLGAVGPGGTLEALIARYSHAVHVLDQNVRQVDPDERAALAELRAGNVKTAVDWYRQNDRVVTAPDRDQALDAMVAAWAGDVAGGKEAVMMAWRKTNVAALNARARTAMQTAGELTGPELAVGAGRVFQAGERIVTLAPSAGGEVVTSERGTVTAIDLTSRSLTARMDDGRTQTFGADDLHPDKVGYGYATTVHRCQGATTDVAHLFADGGGRELGYVAMSRARHSTRVHVVADDIEQAGEDLVRDWGHQRRQVWALDTGTPTDAARPEVHPLETELDQTTPAALRATLARARLTAERHALAAAVGDGILADTTPAQHHLAGLDRHIHSLNPATAGVVRTPTSPRTPTRTWAAPAYPVHRAPPAPDRGAGPSL